MKYVTIAALSIMAWVLVSSVGGKIEGRYFPVVDDVQINQMEPSGPVSTRFWGSFRKLRECDFDDIVFNVGKPGTSSVAIMEFEEGAGFRTPGRQDFGPWNVQLSPYQIENSSFSDVYHRCGLFPALIDDWLTDRLGFRIYRPWLTVTRFHP